MFKVIKDNKIIGISKERPNSAFLSSYMAIVEDTEHSVSDYEQYQGVYLLITDVPTPTKEEQSEKRKQAYILEKDPITCHIQSLKDEEQTPEIREEIETLKQERAEKVQEIKERYPYPEE